MSNKVTELEGSSGIMIMNAKDTKEERCLDLLATAGYLEEEVKNIF